jgi:hypothetical protein
MTAAIMSVCIACLVAGWVASLATARLERQKRQERELSADELTHDETS